MINDILDKIKNNEIDDTKAKELLKDYYTNNTELSYAKLDHNRKKRKGFPEVIFAQGKTSEQVTNIFKSFSDLDKEAFATRASIDQYNEVIKLVPTALYNEQARIIYIEKENKIKKGNVAIVCAGTSDLNVAYEASLTVNFLGANTKHFFDVGVAGIHRLFNCIDEIKQCDVIIVIAGMEGALPSVVAGLVDKPIIAIPTSVGYGASFNGLAPLLTMLNSCAEGISVVNIDNGFGAGYNAALICRLINGGK